MEWEPKIKTRIDVNTLIALCKILDNYEEFNSNLLKLNLSSYISDKTKKLYNISKGETVFGAPKLKKFYQENKKVIDTINEHTDIERFIKYNYLVLTQKKLEMGESLNLFYQYLLRNREQLGQILSVLEKIKALGFDKIKLLEGFDFTKESQMLTVPYNSGDIVYLDNIQIESNYLESVIRYHTTGSNYKIVFPSLLRHTIVARRSSKTITLNSLVFDPSRLPDKISERSAVDYIVDLRKKQDESCFTIRTSVDLSINIDELQERYESLYKVMEELKNTQIKEEVRESLVNIQTELAKLQALSTQYDSTITEENPNITLEKLAEERKLYLARRDSTDFDKKNKH